MACSRCTDSDMDFDEGDESYEDYYNTEDDCEEDQCDPQKDADPEYFEYECLSIEEVEKLLNEAVESLSDSLQVMPSLAKVLLHSFSWTQNEISRRYKVNANNVLIESRVKPARSPTVDPQVMIRSKPYSVICPVCLQPYSGEDSLRSLSCGHFFCEECWETHFEIKIWQGISIGIECMARDCDILVPEDFVLGILTTSSHRERYQQFAFADYVKSHPELRFCPGPDCSNVVRAIELKSKRVVCKLCETSFCFRCGLDYHAPTDCDTIRKWLTKCADDSGTANYISAHTKDCPKCHVCIEKNGGCNRMRCYSCKQEFCWMCLEDWKVHDIGHYQCSRYKENPQESVHSQAREALKKYLFHFERWENHSKSLKLEEQTLQKIKDRIHDKVMKNEGTWIDWQYLVDSANLLAKCRYTLQYTYAFAYFMEPASSHKELFAYQQAQLEAEIENLSWKIERAETTDRADLENQMDVAEKRRTTLLKDFLEA